MNGKRIYLILALTIAVAAVLIVPVYAFTSSVNVNDNTVESTSRSIDIKNQTDPFSVTPPEYNNVSDPVYIRNHIFEIAADGNVEMRAWLFLDDYSDWLILDHAELVIYREADQSDLADPNVQKYTLENDVFEEYEGEIDPQTTYYVQVYDVNFGEEQVSGDTYQSLVPTPVMTLDPEIEYKFDLVFHFKGMVGSSLYNIYAANFAGTVTFAIADNDPVPTPVPSP